MATKPRPASSVVAAAAVLVGLFIQPADARTDGSPNIPQDVLFEVLKKQADIGFEGERARTRFSTDPDRENVTYRQRVLHRPSSDYRIDYLSGLREGSEWHYLIVKDHTYEWPDRGGRVTMREHHEDPTQALVITQEYLKLLLENYDIKTSKGSPIAGRETYEVRIVPKYAGRASLRVWVDTTWGVPLRLEQYDHTNRIVMQTQYETVTFKESVPAEYFTLPAGMEVRQERSGIAYKGPAELHADRQLLTPVAEILPAGFRLTGVTVAEFRGRPTVQSFYSDGYNSFSLFAIRGVERIPEGASEPGVRGMKSGRRRDYNFVEGWIGEFEIRLVSGRLPEYEIVRMFPSVRLASKEPVVTYMTTPPPAPPGP